MKKKFIYLICCLTMLMCTKAQTHGLNTSYELNNTQAIKKLPRSANPNHKVLNLGSPHFGLGNKYLNCRI